MNTWLDAHFISILDWYEKKAAKGALTDVEVINLTNFDIKYECKQIVNLFGRNLEECIEHLGENTLIVVHPKKISANCLLNLNQKIIKTGASFPGFVFPRFQEELDFNLLKMDFRFPEKFNGLAISEIGKRYSRKDIDSKHFEKIEFNPESLLKESYDIFSIHSHGEVGHFLLNGYILCGSSSPIEVNSNGEELNPGCHEEDCKRINSSKFKYLKFIDIKTMVMFAFTCHGFSPTDQYFDSNVKSIFAVQNGFPNTFLSTIDSHSYDIGEVKYYTQRFMAGDSVGLIIDELNKMRSDRDDLPTFFLWGLPNTKVGKKIDDIVEEYEPVNSGKDILDLKKKIDNLQKIYSKVEEILIGLHLPNVNPLDNKNYRLLVFYHWELRRVIQFLKGIYLTPEKFTISYHLKSIDKKLKNLGELYDTSIKKYLSDNKVANGVMQNLHFESNQVALEASGECSRCKTTIYLKRYRSDSGNERVFKSCVVCGPHAHECENLRVSVENLKIENNSLKGKIQLLTHLENEQKVLVHLFFVDKTRGGCSAKHEFTLSSNEQNFTIDLPDNVRKELHTLKAHIISWPNISIYRWRVST